jgi:hypothetical protein
VKKLSLILLLISLPVMSQDVTLFIDGEEFAIPEGKRLVLVPDHWLDEEIYRESHRAEGITTLLPTVVECDPDELVISPGSCPE